MPDYKESTITGAAWQRCHEIVVSNTRNSVPRLQFFEERVIALEGGGEIRQPLGAMEVGFDPARVIALHDPATGLPTGEVSTYGAAHALLYSAYMSAATERDADLPAPTEPEGV